MVGFHFTSNERIGIIALIIISISIVFYRTTLLTDIQNNIPLIENRNIDFKRHHYSKYPKKNFTKQNYTLFTFDPNTLPIEGFLKMGFSEKQADVIMRYRAKGGKFKTSDDFAKIYSIPKQIKQSILSYITIDTSLLNLKKKKWQSFPKQVYSIDINSATEDELIKLPHIGCSRAHSIIAFREKIGGFYSLNQMLELYNFSSYLVDSIKGMFKLDSSQHKRININTASISEMKTHPYFKYFSAKKIVDYRNIKGLITSPSELLTNKILDSVTYRKVEHYISIK